MTDRLRHATGHAKRVLGSLAAQAVMVVVGMASLGLAAYVNVRQISLNERQRELTACLAGYNDDSNRVTAARAQLADQDRALDAQDQADYRRAFVSLHALTATLNDPHATRPERAAAFAAFDRVLAEVDASGAAINAARARHAEERRRNPIPEPPSQRC